MGNLKNYTNMGFDIDDEQHEHRRHHPNATYHQAPRHKVPYLNGKSISISPSPDKVVSIAWRNLRYEVKQYGGVVGAKKPILRRLNGYFECHTLNGLMGPSGCGKTTFLNCLSGKARTGLAKETEIYLQHSDAPTVSYFIEQHVQESIVGRMSVRDILRYAFRFKNGTGHSEQEMMRYIAHTIHELMLDEGVLDRHFERCSGGEKKRIAIAQELMSLQKPTFLFIDEPTTGLDSASAYEVMSCLKHLTTKYRITVVASIHLPNDETLSLFDKLYVLAKGGVPIYSGPPRQIESHLEREIHCRVHDSHPPVEVLLKLACNGPHDPNIQRLATTCLTREYHGIASRLQHLAYQPAGISACTAPFSVSHLGLQMSRLFRIVFVSNFSHFAFNVCQYVLLFVILSTIYSAKMAQPTGCYELDQENSTLTCSRDLEDGRLVDENHTFQGYTILLIGFLAMCTSAILFSPIVKVFRNEHRNHWYSLGVFYWSASVVSFLEVTFYSLLISLLAYFLSGQQWADNADINYLRLGHYVFFIWLLCIYTQSIGHLIGAILVDYIEVAIILCQVSYVFMALMNGYFVDTEKTGNVAFIQLANLIAVKYVTKGLMYTFYGIDRCDPETEFSSVLLKFHVEEDQIGEYVFRVAVNVVIMKAITLAYMYYKFNSFVDHPFMKFVEKIIKKSPYEIHPLMPIDFTHKAVNSANGSKKESESVLFEEEGEAKFDQFSRNRTIIAWRNLSLFGSSSVYETGSGQARQNAKPILRSLNGQVKFGTLCASMGSSGCGKTSLLRVLNGQCKTRLGDEGEFYLTKFAKIQTCFITQDVSGHLMPGLTAQQMLVYASRLKNLDFSIDHERIAMEILEKLDLVGTAHTKVDRCSGGERKRLALALELTALQMPNLICIDEPISGLDSNSAEMVISCLRKLTQTHSLTIITSIHQPSTQILMMFDQLYVLARGGVCIYSGPPSGIQTYLSQVPQINQTYSKFPSEILIKHSCSDHDHPIVQKLIQLNNRQFFEDNAQLAADTQPVPDGVVTNRHRFSLHSVLILSMRYFTYIRGYLWHHLAAFVVVILIYGHQLTIFFDPSIAVPSGCIDLDSDFNNTCRRTAEDILEEYKITENYKFNYFMLVVFLFLLMLQSSLIFGKEFVHFLNEHRNGWYSSGSFYLMKSLFEILPLPFIIMAYLQLVNIYEDIIPGMYWNLVFLLTLSAIGFQGMAHVFSLLANGSIMILTIISISVFILFCQISNFFIPLANLHYIYQIISNLSISRFVFEASLLLQYGFGRCGPKELQPILYSMSISDEHYYECIRMLIANLILYRALAVWLLIAKSNPMQHRRTRVSNLLHYQSHLAPNAGALESHGLGACDQQFRIKLIAL